MEQTGKTQSSVLLNSIAGCAAVALGHLMPVQAQTFQRVIGGANIEIAYGVLSLPDGGFVVTGQTSSFGAGNDDMHLIRTDHLGEVLWTRTYGGQFNEVGARVRRMPDGGFAVFGTTDNSWGGLRRHYLVRTDATGEPLWTRSIGSSGNDDGTDLIVMPDGGFIITGNSGTYGNRRVLVVRLDANGELLWFRQPGGPSNDSGNAIAAAPGGGFIVVGRTESFGAGGRDMLVLRMTDDGTILWSRTYGGQGFDEATGVVPGPDGGWVISGTSDSFGGAGREVVAMGIDGSGAVLWAKTYGGPDMDSGRRIIQANGEGYLIPAFGQNAQPPSDHSGVLLRIDAEGNTIWTRTFGTNEFITDLLAADVTSDGYIAVGLSAQVDMTVRTYLVRMNEDGESGCQERDLTWEERNITLSSSTPELLTGAIGITVTTPPTEVDEGGTVLDTPCLDITTGLAEMASEPLQVFPNPAQDRITILHQLANPHLRIVDGRGRIVHDGQLHQPVLDVSGYAPGVYMGLLTGGGALQSLRFVKE